MLNYVQGLRTKGYCMPRKKTYYKYWELPQWNGAVIDVTKRFIHNGIEHLTLYDGGNRYVIRMPKRDEWRAITKPQKIVVTKILDKKNSARLIIDLKS